MTDTKQLDALRQQIDQIDQQLHQLFHERAKLAIKIGEEKRTQTTEPLFFYKPEREAQIMQKIMARNHGSHKGPLTDAQVSAIFRPLLTACLNLQMPIQIAFLGPSGTFSHAAVIKHFGEQTCIIPEASIADVYRAVESKVADYGVVPIENSSTGVIHTSLDLLINSPLIICGEIILPIHHHLLGKKNTSLEEITRVYAHEQALMQCQLWLGKHLPKAELIAVGSNGAAAKRIVEENHVAAIAGDLAMHEYQLQPLAMNIEDHPHNQTRFLILGRQNVGVSGCDKTSLIISTPHTPGFLYELLKPFAEQGVNLSLIESRPYQNHNWSYLFFMDVEGHQEDANVKTALDKLMNKAVMVNVLGSYPRAVE